MTRAGRSIAIAIVLIACASSVAAQANRPPVKPSRFIVSAGLVADGGYPIGDRNAELRANSTAASPAPFTLFHADASLDRVAGFEARFGYALSRRISIEIGGTRATPRLSVSITQDGESSGTTVVAERVSQYGVDIAGLVKLPFAWRAAQIQPYALAGGGYLRQLHEDRLLVETGRTIFGGGGVQYAFRPPGRGRPMGVRAEARLVRRTGGIDFEDESRSHGAISVLAFFGF